MASLQALNLFSSTISRRGKSRPSLHASNDLRRSQPRLLQLQTAINTAAISLEEEENNAAPGSQTRIMECNDDGNSVAKLYAILEAAADREQMHAIIGEQRNNWHHLLHHSINSITLAASIMAGMSAIPLGEAASPHCLAFKLSSSLLFATATGLMALVNKIQPSQLTEEQRNARRLFNQLEKSTHTTLALRAPTKIDVDDAVEKLLAIDKAYPLPLCPGMLEKFPETVEPTVWWPKLTLRHCKSPSLAGNGWNEELEEEMKGVLKALKEKDIEQYVRVGKLILKINKVLAFLGPLLSGAATVGAGLIGSQAHGALPVLVAVVSGVLAVVANTLEHGGQLGMLFELLRNCAGLYRQLEEEIENNLEEREVERREDGYMFKFKMALKLGRSLPELKSFARTDEGNAAEFAGKLF